MRVSLPTRLFLGFVVLLLLFSGLQVWSLLGLQRLGSEFGRINRFHLSFSHQTFALETSQSQLLLLLKNLSTQETDPEARRSPALLTRWLKVTSEKRNETYERMRALVAQNVARLDGEEAGYYRTTLAPMLAQLELEWKQVQEIWAAGFSSGLERPDVKALFRKESLLLSRIRQLVGAARTRVRQLAGRIEDSERDLLRMQITLLVVAFVLALAIIVLSYRPLRVLARLTQGARRLGQGDFSHRIEVTGQDELGQLAAEFNSMTEAILEREGRLIRSEQLAAAGKLSAQIAHELRNPLAALSFQVELVSDLCRDLPEGQAREEMVDLLAQIQKEVDRLTGISEEYLVFARLPKPQPRPLDVNALLDDFRQFLEGELELGRVRLELVLDPSGPRIAGDEGLLRQVLLNLVRNAREAMPEGGRLLLESAVRDREVVVAVEDEGPGITGGQRARLFEAFYTTKAHGTGLGLTVSLQILHQHGGTIAVLDAPGGGARFELRLPALAPAAAPTEE